MDRKDDFTDEKLEELLRSMPAIKDSRAKEDILLKLKEDDRLQSRSKKNSMKKKRSKWIPALIAISAIFLFSLLLPSMLQTSPKEDAVDSENLVRTMDIESEQEGDADSKALGSEELGLEQQSADEQESEVAEVAKGDASEEKSDSSALASLPELASYAPVVYPKDVIEHTVFRIGLASDAAASLPITFVIPNNQIQINFGKLAPTSFELYEMYADKIDEEGLGFTSYHPYKGELKVEGDAIIQTLPKGHNYDLTSATIETYLGTLQDTFYGFKEIIFQNEDGTPVEFDQVGEPSEPMPLMSGKEKVNYYLFKQGDGQEFLSSNFGKSYETLEVALNDMKVVPNDFYSPVIPATIGFKINEENNVMTITFDEPLDLNVMEPKSAQQMIDGILLTAASFDTQVKFKQIVQSEWRGFDFNEPLPMPIGANYMRFVLK